MERKVQDPYKTSEFIETPMSLSEFNKNIRFEDIRSIINFVFNLILMVPATIPEMPLMGYNLHARRHFILNKNNLLEQKKDLQDQLETYCKIAAIESSDVYSIKDDLGDESICVITINFRNGLNMKLFDDGTETQLAINARSGKDFSK